jgi:TetR/AcrR family transcriptional regulator, regulator of autoinduction and epiphytic fitness
MRTVPRPGRDGKPPRAYRSAQRSAQARRTRERIIAAASEQFNTAGYPATTMRSIAAAASVSVASIELNFGTKPQLLKAAIDVAIAGDHEPVAVLHRDWARRAQQTTDVTDFLTAVGRTLRPAMARSAGLVVAAQDAARTDPAVQPLAEQLDAQRAATVAWIVDGIRERAALRQDTTRRHAIDQVWLLMDPAVYQRLTQCRGWSPARYQRWFVDAVARLVVD